MAGMDDGGVNHQVVVDELRRAAAVGEDASDGAGHQEDVLRPIRPEPIVHSGLVAEFELAARRHLEIREALAPEPAHDRGAHQPAVTRHENPGVALDWSLRHREKAYHLVS